MAPKNEPKTGSSKPDRESILAAYQITANLLLNEGQLIWRRTGIFVAFNSLVAAALHYVGGIPVWLVCLIAALGFTYSVCWHFSMTRAWHYYEYYHALMREQEKELNLEDLGPSSRGMPISQGNQATVGGEKIQFGPTTMLFRAKLMADVTTWVFAAVYLIYAIQSFCRLASRN